MLFIFSFRNQREISSKCTSRARLLYTFFYEDIEQKYLQIFFIIKNVFIIIISFLTNQIVSTFSTL